MYCIEQSDYTVLIFESQPRLRFPLRKSRLEFLLRQGGSIWEGCVIRKTYLQRIRYEGRPRRTDRPHRGGASKARCSDCNCRDSEARRKLSPLERRRLP